MNVYAALYSWSIVPTKFILGLLVLVMVIVFSMVSVEFPFLVLLVSGGHCLLAVVQSVDDFLLLGQSVDDAPGDAFDKVF